MANIFDDLEADFPPEELRIMQQLFAAELLEEEFDDEAERSPEEWALMKAGL